MNWTTLCYRTSNVTNTICRTYLHNRWPHSLTIITIIRLAKSFVLHAGHSRISTGSHDVVRVQEVSDMMKRLMSITWDIMNLSFPLRLQVLNAGSSDTEKPDDEVLWEDLDTSENNTDIHWTRKGKCNGSAGIYRPRMHPEGYLSTY